MGTFPNSGEVLALGGLDTGDYRVCDGCNGDGGECKSCQGRGWQVGRSVEGMVDHWDMRMVNMLNHRHPNHHRHSHNR